MYEISRKQERERRKIIFPARLHVRDITENVVGLDLAEMGCRIKSKYRFNILSKIILEFYIPSREEGKYVVGDPMGNVIVRWTKPSKQQGYFILGLEFGSKPRENHGVTELLVGPRSQTAKQLKCHIITVPPSIIEKIEKFGKNFKDLTIETVRNFLIDSRKSNFKI